MSGDTICGTHMVHLGPLVCVRGFCLTAGPQDPRNRQIISYSSVAIEPETTLSASVCHMSYPEPSVMKQLRPNTPFEMLLGNSQFASYAILRVHGPNAWSHCTAH
jgi:hypothetical protein